MSRKKAEQPKQVITKSALYAIVLLVLIFLAVAVLFGVVNSPTQKGAVLVGKGFTQPEKCVEQKELEWRIDQLKSTQLAIIAEIERVDKIGKLREELLSSSYSSKFPFLLYYRFIQESDGKKRIESGEWMLNEITKNGDLNKQELIKFETSLRILDKLAYDAGISVVELEKYSAGRGLADLHSLNANTRVKSFNALLDFVKKKDCSDSNEIRCPNANDCDVRELIRAWLDDDEFAQLNFEAQFNEIGKEIYDLQLELEKNRYNDANKVASLQNRIREKLNQIKKLLNSVPMRFWQGNPPSLEWSGSADTLYSKNGVIEKAADWLMKVTTSVTDKKKEKSNKCDLEVKVE